jgi:hypothetical protein
MSNHEHKDKKHQKVGDPRVNKDEKVDCSKMTDAERMDCEEKARKLKESTEIKTTPVHPE